MARITVGDDEWIGWAGMTRSEAIARGIISHRTIGTSLARMGALLWSFRHGDKVQALLSERRYADAANVADSIIAHYLDE